MAQLQILETKIKSLKSMCQTLLVVFILTMSLIFFTNIDIKLWGMINVVIFMLLMAGCLGLEETVSLKKQYIKATRMLIQSNNHLK